LDGCSQGRFGIEILTAGSVPTVSVITINYNNLRGLRRTFASVQQQTARNEIQWIVVDGNSSDGSVAFLREHAAEIEVLCIEKDAGIYDAMNKGLALAEAPYVWFMNSGDIIYQDDVAEKLCAMTASNPDVLFGDTMFIDERGMELGLISKLKPQRFPEKLDKWSFRFGMNLCHQSFIAKKSICPAYDLQYRQAADVDWIIRILEKNPVNVRYDGVIAGFETGGSSAQHEKKAWKERFNVLSKHYGFLPNCINHCWIVLRRLMFNLKNQ
jgi:glycosyltransferase involved in cell wall biosynthesis